MVGGRSPSYLFHRSPYQTIIFNKATSFRTPKNGGFGRRQKTKGSSVRRVAVNMPPLFTDGVSAICIVCPLLIY